MGTVASLIVPPPFTTPPSALAVASPDLVSITRVLPSALNAPLADLQVADDAQTHVQVIAAAPDAGTTPGAQQGATGALTGNLNSSGPSASFLAQLYGQGGDPDNITLATTVARFAPAPVYNAFVQYGYIKYRPSDAGISQLTTPLGSAAEPDDTTADSIPLQSAGATQAQNDNAFPAAAANDYQAYSNTQLHNQANLFPTGQQVIVSG